MKLSYLVTCHNETTSLSRCLESILQFKDDEDDVVVLDDFSDNPKTQKILASWGDALLLDGRKPTNLRVIQHALDKNYGGHKNFGNEQCIGDYVFQIDGDEIPSPNLVANAKAIIEANPTVELFFVARINDFIGVTEDHAKMWGWRLSPCSACDDRLVVNWPDWQSRIYKREPSRIQWDRRLHEKIEGYTISGKFPEETDFALYHDKTIETQLKTNIRYNEWFTQEENRGHNVFGKK